MIVATLIEFYGNLFRSLWTTHRNPRYLTIEPPLQKRDKSHITINYGSWKFSDAMRNYRLKRVGSMTKTEYYPTVECVDYFKTNKFLDKKCSLPPSCGKPYNIIDTETILGTQYGVCFGIGYISAHCYKLDADHECKINGNQMLPVYEFTTEDSIRVNGYKLSVVNYMGLDNYIAVKDKDEYVIYPKQCRYLRLFMRDGTMIPEEEIADQLTTEGIFDWTLEDGVVEFKMLSDFMVKNLCNEISRGHSVYSAIMKLKPLMTVKDDHHSVYTDSDSTKPLFPDCALLTGIADHKVFGMTEYWRLPTARCFTLRGESIVKYMHYFKHTRFNYANPITATLNLFLDAIHQITFSIAHGITGYVGQINKESAAAFLKGALAMALHICSTTVIWLSRELYVLLKLLLPKFIIIIEDVLIPILKETNNILIKMSLSTLIFEYILLSFVVYVVYKRTAYMLLYVLPILICVGIMKL